MTPRWTLKRIAHRTGFIASPSLAFQGVPFGRKKRDLAGDVLRSIGEKHEARLATVTVRPHPGGDPGTYDYWCATCNEWLPAEMTYGSTEREARECGLDHRAEEHAGVTA